MAPMPRDRAGLAALSRLRATLASASSRSARLASSLAASRLTPAAGGLAPRQKPRREAHLPATLRGYATGSEQNIAVLGGGLSGLTTAYYLAKFLPSARITVYESSDRLGGWIDTEEVEVGDGQRTYFERGARMVAGQGRTGKYDDLVFLDLIDDLNLFDQVRTTPHRASVNIYYPDHIVPIPTPSISAQDPLRSIGSVLSLLHTALTEPAFAGTLPSAFRFLFGQAGQQQGRPPPEDESIGDFFLRAFGRREPVDNLLSAVVHGIYGGDVWKLSVASSMFASMRPVRRDIRRIEPLQGRLTRTRQRDLDLCADLSRKGERYRGLVAAAGPWAQTSFARGLGTLTDALADSLRANERVTIKLGESVTGVRHDEAAGKVEIKSSSAAAAAQQPGAAQGTAAAAAYDKVVSTLFSGTLHGLTGGALPSLAREHAVTIMAVNLFYPTPGLNLPARGFGYLVPQSVPAEQNPEAALGAIFDTEREMALRPPPVVAEGEEGQEEEADEIIPPTPTPTGTKLTVLLGGHFWDFYDPSDLPSPADAVEMAKSAAARHLRIPAPLQTTNVTASAKLCRRCIPQHYVGHRSRMAAAHAELTSSFAGRLSVAGGSYTPPGVLPSLRAARDLALRLAGTGYRTPTGRSPMAHVGDTGLGQFASDFSEASDDPEYLVSTAMLPMRYGGEGWSWDENRAAWVKERPPREGEEGEEVDRRGR